MAGAKIKFDLDLCKGCKICTEACFVDVIRWNEEEKKPFAAYPEDCAWCYAKCIDVVPNTPWRVPAPY
jgi:NAD-dependent dihydropyrimidine dehydrogenase PreA subunit